MWNKRGQRYFALIVTTATLSALFPHLSFANDEGGLPNCTTCSPKERTTMDYSLKADQLRHQYSEDLKLLKAKIGVCQRNVKYYDSKITEQKEELIEAFRMSGAPSKIVIAHAGILVGDVLSFGRASLASKVTCSNTLKLAKTVVMTEEAGALVFDTTKLAYQVTSKAGKLLKCESADAPPPLYEEVISVLPVVGPGYELGRDLLANAITKQTAIDMIEANLKELEGGKQEWLDKEADWRSKEARRTASYVSDMRDLGIEAEEAIKLAVACNPTIR